MTPVSCLSDCGTVTWNIVVVKPHLHDTTGCQPGEQPVEQPVRQPVECLFTRYSRLFNRSDNRLYRVNGVLQRSSRFKKQLLEHYFDLNTHESRWCHCQPTVSCSSKNPEWFAFLVPAYPGCPGKKPLNRYSNCSSSSSSRSSRSSRSSSRQQHKLTLKKDTRENVRQHCYRLVSKRSHPSHCCRCVKRNVRGQTASW